MAQIDSLYIRTYDFQLMLRPYISQEALYMNMVTGDEEIMYKPNTSPKAGVSFSINNTIVSFGYGYSFDFLRNKKHGRTNSFDFQLHTYTRHVVYDVHYQNYSGFYSDKLENGLQLHPDLNIKFYSVNAQYIFNHKKFSYKAAFNQDERQERSAGSFLLGIGATKVKISSDSTFVYDDKNSLRNTQIAINAGYVHTWVMGRFWNISLTAYGGFSLGNENVFAFSHKLRVYPTLYPRLSAGYNRSDWALGFSVVGNMTYPIVSTEERVQILSGMIQVAFVKRFNGIPFLDKIIKKKK